MLQVLAYIGKINKSAKALLFIFPISIMLTIIRKNVLKKF